VWLASASGNADSPERCFGTTLFEI